MWVITGPFDGENGVTEFEKPKILKPDTTYALGRKERPLVINSKKISHDHCEFVVGSHTVESVREHNYIPPLEVLHHNTKSNKTYSIYRGDETIIVPPDSNVPMEPGDVLSLLTGIIVRVEWKPICVFFPLTRAKPSISKSILDGCASLGLKLSQKVHENVTHHLATHYVANLTMAASLLNLSRFVKPEWLNEILRLGGLPRNNEDSTGTSLEDHFILPLETKFRPSFSPSLLPKQKTFDIWEPNEERVNFFKPFRFVCLHEKVTELDSEVREAIDRGGGSFETFDIHLGMPKFHRVLTRSQAKEGKQTIVVGDIDSLQTAIGTQEWGQIVSEVKSFSSDIFTPSRIVQSVIEVDISLLKATPTNSPRLSPLPELVPNSIPEEPSMQYDMPSPPKVPLVRRARAASRESSLAPGPSKYSIPGPDLSPPRQPLVRRAHTRKMSALEDSSSVLDDIRGSTRNKTSPPPIPPYIDLTAPAPPPTKGLKRRAVRQEPPIVGSQTLQSGIGETMEEPPLKKFKALFEASNPKGDINSSFEPVDSVPELHSQTQTQTETQPRSDRPLRSMGASSLGVLREEEEETQTTTHRGSKRRLDALQENQEMEVDENTATSEEAPKSKKRAVENVNAVRRPDDTPGVLTTTIGATNKPPSTSRGSGKQGAPIGKPDTDTAFLKAIASTKRGKKTEDDFDREFNKLKITKPDLERHDPEDEWKVLADFGDDSNIRGNFMTIVEMDLYRKDDTPKPSTSMNLAWVGRPNYKKFKQKTPSLPRPKIELFVSQGNDYGMGSSYWKGGNSQTGTFANNTFAESQMESQIDIESQQQGSMIPGRSQQVADSDDDEVKAPARRSRKPPSKSEGVAPTRRTATKNKAPAKATALFLDSDGDVQEVDEDSIRPGLRSQFDVDQTLPSSTEATVVPVGRRSTRPAKATKKVAPVIVDDDSDDGVVFKGFKGRKGGR